jgi:hypothetical protein
MKKYLFGLGAMLVGAGLMFVLMHGEVMADDPIYDSFIPFVKEDKDYQENRLKDARKKQEKRTEEEEKRTNAIKSVVDREGVPEPFVCSYDTYMYVDGESEQLSLTHCKTKNLDCGYDYQTGNMSCVKTGIL